MARKKKEKDSEDYAIQVTMSPEQARVVVGALDFFMRIHMGQLDELGHQLWDKNGHDDQAKAAIKMLKAATFPQFHMNASHGIRECPNESARVAYDILQVIRYAEAWALTPEGGMTVNFDEPSFVSNSRPAPEAEVLGPLERLARLADKPKRKPK